MKSYGQLCAVSQALDVVGDRWTLLIVRELLITPQVRFTDLQRGLPGIAPNLLAQRLRDLEVHDVVRREIAAPPATGALYALTERGLELEGVVRELLRWGAPAVAGAADGAVFQMHWLGMPARYLLRDNDPTAQDATIRFGSIADGFEVTAAAGSIVVAPCRPLVAPDATVDGPGPTLVALVQGVITLAQAIERGVDARGSQDALRRILPVKPRVEDVPRRRLEVDRASAVAPASRGDDIHVHG